MSVYYDGGVGEILAAVFGCLGQQQADGERWPGSFRWAFVAAAQAREMLLRSFRHGVIPASQMSVIQDNHM
jgi:hypothetical protein